VAGARMDSYFKPADLVKEGKFREDLYYKLNIVEIHLPPLRARTEANPLLVRHFIKKYSGNRTPKQLSREALHKKIKQYFIE
jgi:DNA-binding NtrC family response regulator